MRGDYLTGVRNDAGTQIFTCGIGLWSHPACTGVRPDDSLIGKAVTVWWFEQSVYPFVRNKRVLRLVVAGEEKRTYEKTLRLTGKNKQRIPWFVSISMGCFLILALWYAKVIRRRLDEQ
ncbi:MAG TPA: hypothetical protein PKN34_07900 [Azospira sp.]|nr:hypothetical protein [Accumulibacter sp.]HMW19066.1 hypothetical protein [Accumulibacter sp.]HNC18973.1 hypothetical protein [Accumulibacter sp.]HNL15317.1 hypothetical protein [Accumulibacter sp.]HNN45964.1 hypothetical protein [Azospira sp.]